MYEGRVSERNENEGKSGDDKGKGNKEKRRRRQHKLYKRVTKNSKDLRTK